MSLLVRRIFFLLFCVHMLFSFVCGAVEYDIDIEGACGGEMACSTCHVVLSEKLYESLEEKTEEEEDMLDLAWGVTDT